MKWSEILPQDALNLSVQLENYALEERSRGKVLFPEQDKIFRALNLTRPEDVKVCIVGQDPYHTPGAANGLAFSISDGSPIQPSLRNIFSELNSDLGLPIPQSGDLTKKAYILSSHPSPFSVSKPCKGTPSFKGSKPFSTANSLLLSMGGEPVDWTL